MDQTKPKVSFLPIAVVVIWVLVLAGLYWKIRVSTEDPGVRTPTMYVFETQLPRKVKITYEVPGAPELPERDAHRIVTVPADGLVITSSPLHYGTADDQFVRIRPDGSRQVMHIGYLGMRKNGLTGDSNEFFESSLELEHRDRFLRDQGLVDHDGEPLYGLPYEMMVIRDEFE